jgi:putative integral membrane protein (TIGR02587 family)
VSRERTRSGWAHEADDLARGVGGGLLFGVPLLFTMEVWWIGGATRPVHLLAALGAAFVPVLLLIHTAGFRHEQDPRLAHTAMDAVEAIAVGIVAAGLVLLVIGEIGTGVPLSEALGKVVYEAVPFSIGVALARYVFGGSRAEQGDRTGASASRSPAQATAADLGATLVGAVFVAFNIAPTDEIPLLESAATPPRLLGVVAVSLLASYVIVFIAGFGDQEGRATQEGLFQHPVTETVAAYLLALVAATAMLWFFQRLEDPLLSTANLSDVLLLGLPATIGGAAGRLAV